MAGRIERVQGAGAWLRRRQRMVAAVVLSAAIVVLAFGDQTYVAHYRPPLVSILAAICVVAGIVAGPWVGLSVAVMAGAISISLVLPFGDAPEVGAALGAIAFWALASLLAGFIADNYRRQVSVRQREVDERQRLALALNEIGSTIASGLDKEMILQRVVRLAGQTLAADSAAVCEHEAHWRIAHAWGALHDAVACRLDMGESVIAALMDARAPVAVGCGTGEGVLCPAFRELGLTAGLAAPLWREERLDGVLFVGMHETERGWTRREIEFVQKVSTDLSAALENVRLYEAQLRIATTLQEQMIHVLPTVEGLELAAVSRAADQPELVGGDFYDVVQLSSGRLSLLIGDVEGKGVKAAGLTETVRTMVRALWLDRSDPAAVLTSANELLMEEQGDQYVTVLLGLLDLSDWSILLASAGHPPPVLCAADSCCLVPVLHGPPLGAFEWSYENTSARLAPGETLTLCTDGVIEARRGGELFGERRLLETVRRSRSAAVTAVAGAVREAAERHAGELSDDLQVLVVRAVQRQASKETAPERRTVG
jgi:serine phosphatase RsbU (regulator of sigma subunit)